MLKYVMNWDDLRNKTVRTAYAGVLTAAFGTNVLADDIPTIAETKHYVPPPIREITANDPLIQKSCPQLQDVELITTHIKDIPTIEIKPEEVFFIDGLIGTSELSEQHSHDTAEEALVSNALIYTEKDMSSLSKLIQMDTPETERLILISSNGGSINEYNKITNIVRNRNNMVITSGGENVASAAVNLLISGDIRQISANTDTTIHRATFYYKISDDNFVKTQMNDIKQQNQIPDGKKKVISDYLEKENRNFKENFYYSSTTEISEACIDSFLKDGVDFNPSPEDLLKLGLIDMVHDSEKETIITIKKDKALPPSDEQDIKIPVRIELPNLG